VTRGAHLEYRDDFSDPGSGWPNHKGSRYTPAGYELAMALPPNFVSGPAAAGVIAAYGPRWEDLRASVAVQGDSGGLVFQLTGLGYYTAMLNVRTREFRLIKTTFWDHLQTEIIPWTRTGMEATDRHKISVECNRGRITVAIDEVEAGRAEDHTFPGGLVGLARFDDGRAVFHDLRVEALK
jgi:hypothetical protein